eukprot:TRINITY_DN42096_c0_g1_i1.p1 TRINITY_DN42096_c0_g1~~TRINITY_DN42096_c0_g1_i1.p1  ORF type:complete len:986 (-),score=231.51 TRINITY_DN42096_c0_g1_i1:130-3087(-)
MVNVRRQSSMSGPKHPAVPPWVNTRNSLPMSPRSSLPLSPRSSVMGPRSSMISPTRRSLGDGRFHLEERGYTKYAPILSPRSDSVQSSVAPSQSSQASPSSQPQVLSFENLNAQRRRADVAEGLLADTQDALRQKITEIHESLRAEMQRANDAEALLHQRETALSETRAEVEELREVGQVHQQVAAEQSRLRRMSEVESRRLQEELYDTRRSRNASGVDPLILDDGDMAQPLADRTCSSCNSPTAVVCRPKGVQLAQSGSEKEQAQKRKKLPLELSASALDEVAAPMVARPADAGRWQMWSGGGSGGVPCSESSSNSKLLSIAQASAEEVVRVQVDLGLERQKSSKLQARCQEAEAARDRLQAQLEELQGLRARDAEMREQHQSVLQQVEKLRSDLSLSKQTATNMKSALQCAATERDELRAAVHQAKRELADLRGSEAEWRCRAQSAEEEVRRLRLDLAREKTASTQVQEEMARTTAAMKRYKDQVECLEDRRRLVEAEFRTYQEFHGTGEQTQLKAIASLEFTVEKLSRQVETKETELGAQASSTEQMRAQIRSLEDQVRDLESQRRELHNTVQDLKGNIRVFCRVRPSDQLEADSALHSPEPNRLGLAHNDEFYSFGFDRVFMEHTMQSELFDEVEGLVQSALDGFKVCIFAYGQTGSGKTYTMQGTDEPGCWGLIPRSLSKIFHASQKMRSQGWTWSLQASFLEVYNENPRDLLRSSSGGHVGDRENRAGPQHAIQHHDAWGTIVTNVTAVEVASLQQISELMARAAKQRAVGFTESNAVSSRSHSIFALYLRGTDPQGTELCGALHLVDLSGSERLDKSHSSGERLKETQSINKSLSSLVDVFAAKAEGRVHVPFRNSKLTYLMEPCLSGQGKTLMVVNVRPEAIHSHESLCSLRFARQVNQCDTGGKPKRFARYSRANTLSSLSTAATAQSNGSSSMITPRGRSRHSSTEPCLEREKSPVLMTPMRRRSPCRAATSLRT